MDTELLKQIYDFLNRHRSTDPSVITHVSMGEPRGSFYINRYDLEQFWGLYCDYVWEKSMCSKNLKLSRSRTWPAALYGGAISASNKRFTTSCIAEKLTGTIPVIIDVDIESATRIDVMETGETVYTMKHIYDLIKVYIRVITSIFEDVKDEDLACVVLEKPPYIVDRNGEKRVKNGFHLHFPKLCINVDEQKAHVFPRVTSALENEGIFDDIRPVINTEKLVDDHIYSSPWLLYGSQKNPESGFYRITGVVVPLRRDDSKDPEEEFDFQTVTLEEVFTDMIQPSWVNKSKPIEWYLPRLLSVIDVDKVRVAKKLKKQCSLSLEIYEC